MAVTAIPGNLLASGTSAVDPGTAGWQARLNCTISLGSGGRNGDGCLRLTSTAAGEMQAQTTAAYPVAAGQTYFTFADASASAQPERIGILWLDATYAPVGSVTWSVTTAAASASWHRISVAGVAPVGAVRARVVLSSQTPAGAGVSHFFENVYLGAPLRFPGNLLSFNAEAGAELDLAAWAAEANCTLSRIVPVSIWSAFYYYAGGHQVGLTVTANGNASALCAERAPVNAGVDYVGFAYLSPPTSSSSTWVELRYYNDAGSQVQATRSTLAAPGTGWYRQVVSAVAPAGAVTASLAVGITSGTAGQVVRTEGAYLAPVAVGAAATQRTDSVLPMQDWDFEQGVGAWSVTSGVATIARSTPWGAQAYYDFYSLTVSSSTATTSVLRSGIYPLGDGAEGQNWRRELYTKVTAGGWTYTETIRWFDGTGSFLSASSTPTGPVPGSGWWSLSADSSAPPGAASAQMELTLTATSTSSVLQIDRPAVWREVPLAGVEVDAAHGSVRLVQRELVPGELMTVYRVMEDGSRAVVRGADGMVEGLLVTSDSYVVTDYEAPLGVPVYYQIELRSATTGAVTQSRRSVLVTVPDPGGSMVWLKDPVEPQRNLLLVGETPPSWTREIETGEFRVRGRRNTVVLTDVRQGYTGDVEVFTRSDEERRLLHWLLDTGRPILIQTGPGTGIEDTYVSVGEAAENRVTAYAPEPWREWTLPLTQVDRPTGRQAGSATRTWQDVRLENATWGDVLARYATWLDVLLDRPKQAG